MKETRGKLLEGICLDSPNSKFAWSPILLLIENSKSLENILKTIIILKSWYFYSIL